MPKKTRGRTKSDTKVSPEKVALDYSNPPDVKAKPIAKITRRKNNKAKTECEVATLEKRPYVGVVGLDVNYEIPLDGSFELEWNSYFIDELKKVGFQGKTDEQIIDQWFTALCKTIVNENWEQSQADPDKRNKQ